MKYVFLHIEKTAGTSLVSYFRDEFKEDFLYVHPSMLNELQKNGELDGKMMVAGHFSMKEILHYFPGRKIITFLRNPDARLVSFYNFAKNNPETTDYITIESKKIDIVNFFKLTIEKNDRRFLNGMTHKLNSEINLRNELQSALLNLEQIDFIGFQETFSRDLNELSKKYGFHRVDIVPKENITKKYISDNDSKELYKIMNNMLLSDRKIYEQALQIKGDR